MRFLFIKPQFLAGDKNKFVSILAKIWDQVFDINSFFDQNLGLIRVVIDFEKFITWIKLAVNQPFSQ